MADYKKYKEFIPLSFAEKNRKLQEKGKKKGKLLLIILNLILLPLNVNGIKEKSLEVKMDDRVETVAESGIDISAIEKWFPINKIDFISIQIENGQGKIVIDDLSRVREIEEAGYKINSLKEENKGYIVEIKY